MALSTALKNRLDVALHSVGEAEELATALDNATTAIGSATAADLTKLHAVTATAAEMNTNAGVTAGTVTASKEVVAGASKQLDTLAVATQVVGVDATPGAATQALTIAFKKTGIADSAATSILTITCPNITDGAVLELLIAASVNNAGALDSTRVALATVAFSRVAGAALVGTIVASTNAGIATSGSATLAAFNVAVAAVGGAVGATNTMDVQVTLVKTGGTNHQVVVKATLLNTEAGGMTMAAA